MSLSPQHLQQPGCWCCLQPLMASPLGPAVWGTELLPSGGLCAVHTDSVRALVVCVVSVQEYNPASCMT